MKDKNMEKKIYLQPITELTSARTDQVMIVASPGIGGEYDPDIPIDAKEVTGLDDDLWGLHDRRNLWDD